MPNDPEFDLQDGIFVPRRRPRHRDDEYDELAFDILIRMQREHFWYRGRHKLLLHVLRQALSRHHGASGKLAAIDIGGGCGGWLEFVHDHEPDLFGELALGDSSIRALTLAEPVVGSFAARYQIDLLDLTWSERWDVIFLLDVLEHIPEHIEVLREVRRSLRPGGLLFVTTPALQLFWTYNDELAHHQRRYSRRDFSVLASKVDLELVRTEYFMFLLSPALLASRLLSRPPKSATPDELRAHLERTHRIPARPMNGFLERIFSMEASLIDRFALPWGTSIMAVFER